jgi:uncharacterized protein YukJ
MAKILYGVLKGTITGHLRNADDDHYQILVSARSTMFRVAVNVHSTLKPPDLLFQSLTSLPSTLTQQLTALKAGFTKLASKPGGLAQDFVRGGIVNTGKFKVVPGDAPGVGNDLKDTMENAAVASIGQQGSLIYAFGARWGPETTKKDQYFKFLPGNGVHDIHMNQGNDKGHAKDDGVYQDGCLIFEYPGGKYRAFFMAFQSQSFDTDDNTGHANQVAGKKKSRKRNTDNRPNLALADPSHQPPWETRTRAASLRARSYARIQHMNQAQTIPGLFHGLSAPALSIPINNTGHANQLGSLRGKRGHPAASSVPRSAPRIQ